MEDTKMMNLWMNCIKEYPKLFNRIFQKIIVESKQFSRIEVYYEFRFFSFTDVYRTFAFERFFIHFFESSSKKFFRTYMEFLFTFERLYNRSLCFRTLIYPLFSNRAQKSFFGRAWNFYLLSNVCIIEAFAFER